MIIALRPACSNDYQFAKQTYYETMRWIIERLFGWDEASEDRKFAAQFKLEEVRIITVDGHDAGWIQTRSNDAAVALLQFYVVPRLQRRGIGTEILRGLIAEARSQRKPITLAVVKINPVLRLYESHGFQITHEDEYKYYMKFDGTSESPADATRS